ncbi:BTB/POZ domain [Teratosphaeria destructans]|uniref:BTB/POZ domain n=1 Tax=Teratosphaeria destructans TaxID=418781 RepID=A0A9W7SQ25_9PEZI|nr:BTB/POZ domain [Teratosphaeria destructans]
MASPISSRPSSLSIDCPQADLLNALSALHVGGKYSDLRITCNYRQWAVHRAIVCSRSGFFDGACSNAFREMENRTIDLSEDDEDAVDQMIHFFYYLDYDIAPEQPVATLFRHRADGDARRKLPKKLDMSMIHDPLLEAIGAYRTQSPITPPASAYENRPVEVPGKGVRPPVTARAHTPPLDESGAAYEPYDHEEAETPEDETHLLLHARVYSLAEKYDIPALKELARQKFETALACHYDSPELPEAIEEVYCSTIDTDRGLRTIVMQLFANHPQLATTPDINALINELPSLAMDLFKIERGLPMC